MAGRLAESGQTIARVFDIPDGLPVFVPNPAISLEVVSRIGGLEAMYTPPRRNAVRPGHPVHLMITAASGPIDLVPFEIVDPHNFSSNHTDLIGGVVVVIAGKPQLALCTEEYYQAPLLGIPSHIGSSNVILALNPEEQNVNVTPILGRDPYLLQNDYVSPWGDDHRHGLLITGNVVAIRETDGQIRITRQS